MTLVPYGPLWCWNLSGEDAVYFSQPTLGGDGPSLVPISGAGACVARCHFASRLGEPEGDIWTCDIQCARVATLAPDGTYLCVYDVERFWTCQECGAWLPDGHGGCCDGCQQQED